MTQQGIDYYFTSDLMTNFEYSISRTVCSEYLLFFTHMTQAGIIFTYSILTYTLFKCQLICVHEAQYSVIGTAQSV